MNGSALRQLTQHWLEVLHTAAYLRIVHVERYPRTGDALLDAYWVAATLAAVTLAGTSTAAHAQVTDEHARRPPTQGQVGESWHQRQVTAEQPSIASDTRSQ